MARILAIGNVLLDEVLHLNHYPNEDEEVRAQHKTQQLGGNASNSLTVLAQLGHQCHLLATLGKDSISDTIRRLSAQQGIDLQHCVTHRKGVSPMSSVWLNETKASRTIVHYRDLPELSFDDFAKVPIETMDWLHFEGRNIEQVDAMLNLAPVFLTDGQPLSLELEKNREGIEQLIPKVHCLFVSQAFVHALGFDSAQDFMTQYGSLNPSAVWILTWGNQGSYLAVPTVTQDSDNNHRACAPLIHVPAPTIHAVDTLGAGDTFIAACIDFFSQRHVRQQHLQDPLFIHDLAHDLLQQANNLAARKCQQVGLLSLTQPLPSAQTPLAKLNKLSNAKVTLVEHPHKPVQIALLKKGDGVVAYENLCPHKQLPLDSVYKIDVNPAQNSLKCSVHEAYFDIDTGKCQSGVCDKQKLRSVQVAITGEGDIVLV